MKTEKILALINSEEINDWINIFKQKVENEAIKNSEYIQIHNKNYHLNNSDFVFVEELEILNMLEKIDKKISKKETSKNKIAKNYQKATEKLNQKLMQKYERKY